MTPALQDDVRTRTSMRNLDSLIDFLNESLTSMNAHLLCLFLGLQI